MNALQRLKSTNDLSELAKLLGYRPKSLAYILYKIPDEQKYETFKIAKRGGGARQIDAPIDQLKLVQSRLAELLQDCLVEIEKAENVREHCALAHGFHRKRSIVTNAENHIGRRWVFNIDLKDFFPSINFGRVRGYFIKNRHFLLSEKAATVIAQIICHNNQLPQGSPCSPVVSNLLGHMLDIRLNRLAKKYRCSYSRYADDITFSSNKKRFPMEIAVQSNIEDKNWEASDHLRYAVFKSGFEINLQKTRMQFYWSRQDTTGLVVNQKVNVRREYVKLARARCHSLISTGRATEKYHIMGFALKRPYGIEKLRGMFSYIFQVKGRELGYERQKTPVKEWPNFYTDYGRFLNYLAFAGNTKPTILFEGKTDNIYVRCALKALAPKFPEMVDPKDSKTLTVRLFNYSRATNAVQALRGGTGDLKRLIYNYKARISPFKNAPFAHPVVLVVDNDKGSKDVFSAATSISGTMPKIDGSKNFYHLFGNLYLVPTPKLAGAAESYIENFLPPAVLSAKLGTRVFHLPEKGFDTSKHFGKAWMAERVVLKQRGTIDFSGFEPLLTNIRDAIADYKGKPKSS